MKQILCVFAVYVKFQPKVFFLSHLPLLPPPGCVWRQGTLTVDGTSGSADVLHWRTAPT